MHQNAQPNQSPTAPYTSKTLHHRPTAFLPPLVGPDALATPKSKAKMIGKDATRFRHLRDSLILSVSVAMVIVVGLHGFSAVTPASLQQASVIREVQQVPRIPLHKRLIFYNRPPKTGSTTVRIAMKQALDDNSLVAAKCFNMIEWNEMALKTIVNRREVDFYGCHTRMYRERYLDVNMLRGGNVTFMTSTRTPDDIILSAYLQEMRDKKIADISDPKEMEEEVERYKLHVEKYPVNALYGYHGALVPLERCPVEWVHIVEMRKIAERYEIVVDLERPKESSAMVEAVTGLKPNFDMHYNERTKEKSPMLEMLSKVDTSHRSCGNELVHKVLSQQFNIIKDRLLQNRCFDEASGTFEICDKATLSVDSISERTRKESFKERVRLASE